MIVVEGFVDGFAIGAHGAPAQNKMGIFAIRDRSRKYVLRVLNQHC